MYINKTLNFVAEDTLPTLKSLQDQVMFATEEDGENFMSLTCHLLKYAVMEPGVPNPREVSVQSSKYSTREGGGLIDAKYSLYVILSVTSCFMPVRSVLMG